MRTLKGHFLIFWVGQAVSGLGSWISAVGLVLYLYKLTGSGKALGGFMIARLLPGLIFAPVGGWLADRRSRRAILISCDAARCALTLGFALTRNVAAFFVLGFLLACLDKVFSAAQGAYLPALVDREDIVDANAVFRMTEASVSIVGPAVAGLMIAGLSYRSVFIVDAASFAVSMVSLSLIPVAGLPARGAATATTMAEFGAVIGYWKRHVHLFYLTAVRCFDALGSGFYNASLPVFSSGLAVGHGTAYGWIVCAWAAGLFLGAMLVRALAGDKAKGGAAVFSAAVMLMACGMEAAFHCSTAYGALAAVGLGGIGDGISGVLFSAAVMLETPDEMRGKMFGVVIALTVTAQSVGMAAAGALLDRYPAVRAANLGTAIILAGIALCATALLVRRRSARYAAI